MATAQIPKRAQRAQPLEPGWRAPVGSEFAPTKVHYFMPDGWALCRRWREVGNPPPLSREAVVAENPKAKFCPMCSERARKRGRNSKMGSMLASLSTVAGKAIVK